MNQLISISLRLFFSKIKLISIKSFSDFKKKKKILHSKQSGLQHFITSRSVSPSWSAKESCRRQRNGSTSTIISQSAEIRLAGSQGSASAKLNSRPLEEAACGCPRRRRRRTASPTRRRAPCPDALQVDCAIESPEQWHWAYYYCDCQCHNGEDQEFRIQEIWRRLFRELSEQMIDRTTPSVWPVDLMISATTCRVDWPTRVAMQMQDATGDKLYEMMHRLAR